MLVLENWSKGQLRNNDRSMLPPDTFFFIILGINLAVMDHSNIFFLYKILIEILSTFQTMPRQGSRRTTLAKPRRTDVLFLLGHVLLYGC